MNRAFVIAANILSNTIERMHSQVEERVALQDALERRQPPRCQGLVNAPGVVRQCERHHVASRFLMRSRVSR